MTMTSAASTNTRQKLEEEQARQKAVQEQSSAEYAAKQQGVTDTFKQSVDEQTDAAIAAQRKTAAVQQRQTAQNYNTVFDQNRAEQLAAQENLREQMAQAGLTRSGYNATNQTALQISRQNADAATRNARQQAVDAIMQGLAEYEAEMRQQAANTKAQADYTTGQNIVDNWAQGQQQAGSDAISWLNYDAQQETAAQEAEASLRSAVEAHNAEIGSQILSAYNQGNYTLAEQLAADWWGFDENGNVVVTGRDLSPASADARARDAAAAQAEAYENEQDRLLQYAKIDKSSSGSDDLGYPSIYKSYATAAAKEAAEGDGTAAADIVYTVVTQEGNPMTEAEIRQFCLASGVNYTYILNCVQLNTRPSMMKG